QPAIAMRGLRFALHEAALLHGRARLDGDARVLPVRDDAPSERRAFVVSIIVLVNVLIYALQSVLHASEQTVLVLYGLTPWRFTHWVALNGSALDPRRFAPLATSMFLHDGWTHLASNMVYLWTFGRALEGRIGRWALALTYLLSGICAALGQL